MKDVNGGNYLFVTLMNHPEFKEKFQTRLRELDKYIIPTMLSSFTKNLKTIEQYANKDNEIWQNLNEPNWARPEWLLNKTYTQQVNYLNNFLDQHYYWMINNM